ncbi:MAG: peptidase MA family metallohydrolase [Planctomycetota bacterium]|nr:peptidase MA family metallohydrolase [Planctomycetota bacterium]
MTAHALVFLPVIVALLALALSTSPLAQQVVAGSGEVEPRVVAEVSAAAADRLRALQPEFPDLAVGPFTIFVHATVEAMPASLRPFLHPGSPGFALLGRHQVHIVWGEMRRTGASLPGVVAHELVHELLDQFATPHGDEIPRWFHEGLAQHLAGDTYLGAREEDLIWRIGARRLLSFADLRERFPLDDEDLRAAYAQSYSYVAWLVRRYGVGALLSVVAATDDITTFERALVGMTGRSTLELVDGWRHHLQYESGAYWRVLLDQCFNLLLLVSLPVLGVAVMRRFAREKRTRERMERAEAEAVAAAEAAAAAEAQLADMPIEPGTDAGDGNERTT